MKKILLILPLLLCALLLSCDNEPIDEPNINMDIIEEELFSYLTLITDKPLEEEVNCIEFNYTFTLYIFDAEMELINVETVYNNASFITILDGLTEEQSISVSYPITGTLNNGESIAINTNQELQDAIKECSKEARQIRCNNVLKECFWQISALPDFPSEFEDDIYKINEDGTVQLYYNNAIIFGTWVTLYIGDTLYLNIDLIDDNNAEGFWDHNWEVSYLTDTQIEISNDETVIVIKKNCDLRCDTDVFETCEFEDNPNFGNFNLSSFIPCIAIPSSHNKINALSYNFFITEEDAIKNTNRLDSESYNNTENPQTIFVRIDLKTNQYLIEITTISINTVTCTEG